MTTTYADTGVDIPKIRKVQEKINSCLNDTKNEYSKEILAGHYAGLFEVDGKKMTVHCDGVGSKILVASQLDIHDTVGIDAIAMNVNDLICMGSKPIVAVDYIAISKPDDELIGELMKGLVKGCIESGCALVGGETAILPDMLKGEGKSRYADYDLAVTCVGITENKTITGEDVKQGDVLIGLKSSGLHSNGFTLARKVLDMDRWGKEMLVPTKIYVKPVLKMIKNCDVHGIAHITGGAFSKLSRLSKHSKCGFLLDNMPKAEGIFEELQKQITDTRELYRTFNMGIGMVIIVSETDAQKTIDIAKEDNVDAMIIGKTIEKEDVILKIEDNEISLL